ncbi:MAG: hypothetical protein JWO45_2137 [Spartobacteria bacterium]|nr:hypothetical protein [Spartobacteria bacterium]
MGEFTLLGWLICGTVIYPVSGAEFATPAPLKSMTNFGFSLFGCHATFVQSSVFETCSCPSFKESPTADEEAAPLGSGRRTLPQFVPRFAPRFPGPPELHRGRRFR